MKKLLLILAAIAYIAISCEDKPNTLTGGDEPAVDTSADTCSITFDCDYPAIIMIYNHPSDEIDMDLSVESILKHFTITLKGDSFATVIGQNCDFSPESTFDTGVVDHISTELTIDSLKYGKYLVVLWGNGSSGMTGTRWGPNCYSEDESLKILYRDITLDAQHPHADTIKEIRQLLRKARPLVFTEF